MPAAVQVGAHRALGAHRERGYRPLVVGDLEPDTVAAVEQFAGAADTGPAGPPTHDDRIHRDPAPAYRATRGSSHSRSAPTESNSAAGRADASSSAGCAP